MRFSATAFLAAVAKQQIATSTKRADRTVITRDRIRLYIKAGRGGNGLRTYNGVGGSGGMVYAVPVGRMTFDRFCEKFEEEAEGGTEVAAQPGESAKQTKLVGQHGKDLLLKVPLGVEMVGRDNLLLARCSSLNQKYVLATGGEGGCAANAYKGQPGESYWVTVNLKLTPNVGLIGYPNAGKSTLMKALVPNKRIEIADYPWTTKNPQLCYIKFGDGGEKRREEKNTENENSPPLDHPAGPVSPDSAADVHSPFSLSIADLPGIVEGAARNRFRAFDCLKHLEYSEIIVMIVDVHGFQLGPNEPHRSPLETIALLNREMEQYDVALVRKPVLLLINKVDVADGEQKAEELCAFLARKGPTGVWARKLENEELRPRYPICFRSVHAVSAKQGRLGNLKAVLKATHRGLRPGKKEKFREDDVLDVKGKKRVVLE